MLANKNDFSELWNNVCAGCHQSYAKLHYQLYPSLFAYIRGMVRDEQLANDLLQDMFVKLWVKKESIGEILNVQAYFFTAARSITLNFIKKEKNAGRKLDQMAFIDLQISVEELITEKESELKLKRTINSALEKLPVRQREILYLKFYEDLDYNQIVSVTGIKYQSVINHIYRAVQALREDFRYEPELRVA
jgi:RNA polymerase sigma factor (sigma-70 family)